MYTHRAIRDIGGLEEKIKQRIGKALKRYAEEPLKYGTKLTDPKLGMYLFRIGDYRVIFDIEGEEIVVLPVGHRRDIHRML